MAITGLLSLLVVSALLVANRVDTGVSPADRAVIMSLGLDKACLGVVGFHAERRCIQAAQERVFSRFEDTRDSFEKGVSRHEVSDYVRRGYGPCYDRARLLEKVFTHYGFDVRRVAIFERQTYPWAYLKPGIRSHALSEVKTERGWIVVDSVTPTLGVDNGGETYSIVDIRKGLLSGDVDDQTFGVAIPDDFMGGNFRHVYGLYSRHGYFFEPHLPVPEIDWNHFQPW